jgi:hypothetical protein
LLLYPRYLPPLLRKAEQESFRVYAKSGNLSNGTIFPPYSQRRIEKGGKCFSPVLDLSDIFPFLPRREKDF